MYNRYNLNVQLLECIVGTFPGWGVRVGGWRKSTMKTISAQLKLDTGLGLAITSWQPWWKWGTLTSHSHVKSSTVVGRLIRHWQSWGGGVGTESPMTKAPETKSRFGKTSRTESPEFLRTKSPTVLKLGISKSPRTRSHKFSNHTKYSWTKSIILSYLVVSSVDYVPQDFVQLHFCPTGLCPRGFHHGRFCPRFMLRRKFLGRTNK